LNPIIDQEKKKRKKLPTYRFLQYESIYHHDSERRNLNESKEKISKRMKNPTKKCQLIHSSTKKQNKKKKI